MQIDERKKCDPSLIQKKMYKISTDGGKERGNFYYFQLVNPNLKTITAYFLMLVEFCGDQKSGYTGNHAFFKLGTQIT